MVDRLLTVEARTATKDYEGLPVRLKLSSNFRCKILHITIANAWGQVKHEIVMIDIPASWPLYLDEYLAPGDIIEISPSETEGEDSLYLQAEPEKAELSVKKIANTQVGIQFQVEITRDLPFLPDMRDMLVPWLTQNEEVP